MLANTIQSERKYWTKTPSIVPELNLIQIQLDSYNWFLSEGIREVLNEKNAILVESDNPQAMAEGIKKAIKDMDFSAKISEQAYQDVQRYSWDNRAKKILEFIK